MTDFIEIYHGKYLDEIDTKIPAGDIMLSSTGSVSRSIEPGEINFPAGEKFSFTLDNLNHDFSEKYPLSYWRENSRTQAEGAIQDLQIYFRITIAGQKQFRGVLHQVSYEKWHATCRLELNGLTELLRIEERQMLKTFKINAYLGLNLNWDKPLKDMAGQDIDIKVLQFQIEQRAKLHDWPDLQSEMARHLGWIQPDPPPGVIAGNGFVMQPNRDFTRSAFVQIGDVTLLTRIRFYEAYSKNNMQPGSGIESYNRMIHCYVWHRNDDEENGIIPRGRFYSGSDFIEENQFYEIAIHEPGISADENIALKIEDLPLAQNWVIGCPYQDMGSYYQLQHRDYESIDVLDLVTKVINKDVSERHASANALRGWVEITGPAASAETAAAATGRIFVNTAVSQDTGVIVRFQKEGLTLSSQPVFLWAMPPDSRMDIAVKLETAINDEIEGFFAEAVDANPPYIDIAAEETGSEWNGWEIKVVDWAFPDPLPAFSYNSPTAGGVTGGFTTEGIRLLIGGSVFTTSDPVQESESAESVAIKLFNAAVAEADSDYLFTRTSTRINILASGEPRALAVDPRQTGVTWSDAPLTLDFNLFDLSRLVPGRWRRVFVSDAIMYGWIGSTVIESLVAAVRQVAGVMYTTAEGKIGIASRDWFKFFPNGINDPDFDAQLLPDMDIEPTGGPEYGTGFMSYQSRHPIDIIEINNVESREKRTIYADRDGTRDTPTLRNKNLDLQNFRIHDLGIPADGDQVEQAVMRRSPSSPLYPFAHDMEDFLTVPQKQLNVIASTFPFPNRVIPIDIYYPSYLDIDLGSYVYDQQMRLWLVKSFELNPDSQTASLELEFKKQLLDFYESAHETLRLVEHRKGGIIIDESAHQQIKKIADSTDEVVQPVIDIPGLILWMDAADLDSFTLAQGNTVAQWEDKSDSENHSEQGDSSKRPVWIDNQVNGLPGIEFDGNKWLDLKEIVPVGDEFTVFQVITRKTTEAVSVGIASESESSYAILWGELSITISYGESSVNFGTNSETGTAIIKTIKESSATDVSRLYINDTQQGSTVLVEGDTGWNAIGKAAGIFFHEGLYCEILVFDREISFAEQQEVLDYLESKWKN